MKSTFKTCICVLMQFNFINLKKSVILVVNCVLNEFILRNAMKCKAELVNTIYTKCCVLDSECFVSVCEDNASVFLTF